MSLPTLPDKVILGISGTVPSSFSLADVRPSAPLVRGSFTVTNAANPPVLEIESSTATQGLASMTVLVEPRRDFWRLFPLRGWSDVRIAEGSEVPGRAA